MHELVVSDDFLNDLGQLQPERSRQVMNKLHILADNPRHPSLQAHRLERIKTKNLWECYINQGDRLIFEPEGEKLRLWRVGDHQIIDRVHLLSFSAHTPFRRLEPEEPSTQDENEPFEIPEEWLKTKGDRPPDNPYYEFPAAHLRILGVPASLIKAVRGVSYLEDLEKIPGLPAQTLAWLLELVTNPSFEEISYDPGRLVFRTTLDRLEGYCEGQIKRLMLNLSPEQEYFLKPDIPNLMLLRGCAGSGKTTVAVYRAIKLAEKGDKVLFLTFNRTLASVARSLIQELIGPLPKNLTVVHLDGLVMSFVRSRRQDPNIINRKDQKEIFLKAIQEVSHRQGNYVLKFHWSFFRDEIARVIKGNGLKTESEYLGIERYGRKTALRSQARQVVWEVYICYQRLLKEQLKMDWQDVALLAYEQLLSASLESPFDHIVIDEAQDLSPMQLRVAQRLNKGGLFNAGRSIFLVGDAAQTLYSRGFAWKQVGLQLSGRSSTLRKNFRNTIQVAQASAALLAFNNTFSRSDEFVDPQFTQRNGPWPIILECDVTDRELSAITEKILSLIEGGQFRLSDFAILSPTTDLCISMQQTLNRNEIPCAIYSEDDFDILAEQVKILTIHSAKGLEFPVVFLQGLHQGVLPRTIRSTDDEEAEINLERERSLMYVGMTRAAEALYLVSSQEAPSSFLQEVQHHIRKEAYMGGKK
jgi:superfamily I DNA/RNA helicase/mRNA-degrading endonuclease YafQ of YafQ-DinJ toxin-antitoxin module